MPSCEEGGKQWDRNGDALECVLLSLIALRYVPPRDGTDCVKNGQYDVTTMGTMQNVGLMAQKAEEYGSHPTTFELEEAGTVQLLLKMELNL